MDIRVLVTYTTKYGATAEIAKKIGDFRDWEVISSWTTAIADVLKKEA